MLIKWPEVVAHACNRGALGGQCKKTAWDQELKAAVNYGSYISLQSRWQNETLSLRKKIE